MSRWALLLLVLPLASLLAACVTPVEESNPPPVDACAFERDVYPVLARDCGFPACHGSETRAFQVWAPGRTRLDPMDGPFSPATAEEIERTFDRARSMLGAARTPADSMLLRKPLAIDSGGAGHMGRDSAGRDIYLDVEAAGYVTIETWARGRSAACP